MNEALNKKCELLLNNLSLVNRVFLLNDPLLSLASALIFTSADREADPEKLSECKKILGRNTGLLSNLRANPRQVLLSKMALSDDPESYLSCVKDVYRKIHQGRKLENTYMFLAAILICDLGRQDEAEELVSKAEAVRSLMEKDHPVLTASEDTSFIMLLALTDKSVDTIVSDVREAYDYLKKTCRIGAGSNGIQGLSEVLSVSYGDTKEKCDRAVRILNTFKDRDERYGTDSELAVLGSLIYVDLDVDTLADEIIETAALLKENKGFKDEAMGRTRRLMYASMLVSEVYGKESAVMGNAIISNTISSVIAKQISVAISVAVNLASAAVPGDDE